MALTLYFKWENEFLKWTEGQKEKIHVYNTGDSQSKSFRLKILKKWKKNGGALLISDSLFRSSMDNPEMEEILKKSDVIILDERLVFIKLDGGSCSCSVLLRHLTPTLFICSHTMLKNTKNKTFKALANVKTKRRLCLTG